MNYSFLNGFKKPAYFLCLIVALCCAATTHAQDSTRVSYTLLPATVSGGVSGFVAANINNCGIYDFDFANAFAYTQAHNYNIEMTLMIAGQPYALNLARNDMRSLDFVTKIHEGAGVTDVERDAENDPTVIHTFMGTVNNDDRYIARLFISDDNFQGYLWDTRNNTKIYLQSLNSLAEAHSDVVNTQTNVLLAYQVQDIVQDPNKTPVCGLGGDDIPLGGGGELPGDLDPLGPPQTTGGTDNVCTQKYLELVVEADYAYSHRFGMNTGYEILARLNEAEGIYTYYFNLRFAVKLITFYLTPLDVYQSVLNDPNLPIGQVPSAMLTVAKNHWSNQPSPHRDEFLLFTSASMGGVAGLANGFGIIGDNNAAYALVNDDPFMNLSNFQFAENIDHELGHLLNAQHDNLYDPNICSSSNVPVMCPIITSPRNYLYFSTYSFNSISSFLTANNSYLTNTLSAYPSTGPFIKTWSSETNNQYIGSWLPRKNDVMLAGNFDGADNDEELFFASNDANWAGLENYVCQNGSSWQQMWNNYATRKIGTWNMHTGDKYFVGDFNGDGKDELLSISADNNWVSLQEYNPSTQTWTMLYGNNGNAQLGYWNIHTGDKFYVGDFNGDGKDEILCLEVWGNWASMYDIISGAPVFMWSNNASGYVGSERITQLNRVLVGKLTQTGREELLCFNGPWVSVVGYTSNNWGWIWGNNASNNFAGMNILTMYSGPVNYNFTSTQQWPLVGNLDADGYDEFLNLNYWWAGTASWDGSTFQQYWNNGGTQFLSDFALYAPNDYIMVKATGDNFKHVLGIRYSGSNDYTVMSRMYRPDGVNNFRMAQPGTNNTLTKAKDLTMAPNPAANVVHLSSSLPLENAQLAVTDVMGKRVLDKTLNGYTEDIDISALQPGIYFFTVKGNNTNMTDKIEVKR